ncbi:MAG: DUF488 family protein [Candidatus Rokuibacteriota bacterium]
MAHPVREVGKVLSDVEGTARLPGLVAYTVGFSTRTPEELVAMLRGASVASLVDVRTVPRSRYTPQWNQERAAAELLGHGIRYHHLPQLGGFRKPRPDSPNVGWRNPAFRGFADHMATADFAAGLESLLSLAAETPTAIACTEAVPWRCHRSLIADALIVRGAQVGHLMGPASIRPHALTAFARVHGLRLTYPDPDALL